MIDDRGLRASALLLVGCASLFLISSIDDPLYWFLAHAAPGWEIVPALRVSSLLVCALLCFLWGRESLRLRVSRVPWRLISIATGAWISGGVVSLFVFHVWTPQLPTWIDVTSFLGTGLLGEELLFRGAVFTLAATVFGRGSEFPYAAIGISAVLFGGQHLGYHGWHFTSAALTQVVYTTAFGVLLGFLRAWSGCLWIPAAAHLANNLVTVLYRHLGS